jgi:hypothetical protein
VIEAVELLKKLKEGGGAAAGGATPGVPDIDPDAVEELQRMADTTGDPEAIRALREMGQLRENFKAPEDELIWEDEESPPGTSKQLPMGMSNEEVEKRIKEQVPMSESTDELVIPSEPHPRGFTPVPATGEEQEAKAAGANEVVNKVVREGYERRKERANRDARRLGKPVPFPDVAATPPAGGQGGGAGFGGIVDNLLPPQSGFSPGPQDRGRGGSTITLFMPRDGSEVKMMSNIQAPNETDEEFAERWRKLGWNVTVTRKGQA